MTPNRKATFLALATRNPGKIDEFRLGLSGLPVDVKTIEDYPDFPEVVENAATLEGNARLKSEALFAFAGVPSLADDTGLEVAVLGGEPGVQSARYAGDACCSADNRAKLLEKLSGEQNREARFRTVLAFTDAAGTKFFEGVCRGVILTEERGEGGFGYDRIFKPAVSHYSFAELSAEEKNRISHRGQALSSFFQFMEKYVLEI